jgi:putative peptidoglycan lipid II flippase
MPPKDTGARGATLIGAGILLSRLLGLVRERVFAYYFGNSVPAAAFKAALRIPNFLQNLFGEGVLSASFIPVYAQLEARGEKEAADKLAGAIFGLISLVTSILVAVGMLVTPLFITLIAPGFKGEARELTILFVRILFPGTGLLVISAWCLGILNSHRRFFLSYAAPVLWNIAQIATLLALGWRSSEAKLAEYLSYGAVAGSFLQLAVQVPTVRSLLGTFRPTLSLASEPVKRVMHNFAPVVMGRGVVQISAYVDNAYATLITPRAVSALSYAQTLYLIPVSLFGMAVSAAELVEMSRVLGSFEEVAAKLRARLDRSAARIAFFVIPSAAAFLLLGDIVGGTLLQTGRFSAADTRYLWYLLMGSTVGLLASTLGRLYASAFYALKDTRTPLIFAIVRVVLTAVLAYWSALRLPTQLGLPGELGGVGITVTSGVAAWIEFMLLRRTLTRRIGRTGVGVRTLGILWGSALTAGAVGLGIKWGLVRWLGVARGVEAEWMGAVLPPPALNPILTGMVVLIPFGLTYFALTSAFQIPESLAVIRRVLRRGRKG